MIYKSLVISFAATAAAARFHKRQVGDSTSFQLYAYGDDIGGLPLISAGSDVFIGDPASLNDTEAAIVIFTQYDDGVWYGNPNTTSATGTPTWKDLPLSVPGSSSTNKEVQLQNPTNSTGSRVSDGFTFYGTVAFHTKPDGSLESLWGANPSGNDGIWALGWNDTVTTDTKALALKSTPPSSAL